MTFGSLAILHLSIYYLSSEVDDRVDNEVPPDGPVDLEELDKDLPPLVPVVKVKKNT